MILPAAEAALETAPPAVESEKRVSERIGEEKEIDSPAEEMGMEVRPAM